jgi:hypothetical protein
MLNRKKTSKHRKERSVRRCPLVASAEVVDVSSGTRLAARISELGMGGCYVDALNPFLEGTAVILRIVRDSGSFEAKAKVVYVHHACGMGLSFTETSPEHRAILEEWLAEIILQTVTAS